MRIDEESSAYSESCGRTDGRMEWNQYTHNFVLRGEGIMTSNTYSNDIIIDQT